MPDAQGNFRGISVPELPWRDCTSPECTRIGDQCVGYHCSTCGEPCGSQGHACCRGGGSFDGFAAAAQA